jgi:hypothetical protein
MRTTLTLDDDVAAKLKTESLRAGRPFREIVDETLRRGLESRRATAQRRAFKITARDLGNLKPGLPWTISRSSSSMWRARSTGDPRRREPAALCLSSEVGATRGKPSLARSRALGA